VSPPIFAEQQRFASSSLLLGVLPAVVLVAFVLLDRDAVVALLVAAFFVIVVALWFWMRLDVWVDDRAVTIWFRPFVRRIFPLDDIVTAEARRYRPMREYGGWGIRYGLGGRRAYNARGDEGVELKLADGRSIMIGSQRAAELEAAIGKPAQPS